MGYIEATVSVLESDGVVQLTVAISAPDASVTFRSFSLLLNTSNGMTTGWCTLTKLRLFTLFQFEHVY